MSTNEEAAVDAAGVPLAESGPLDNAQRRLIEDIGQYYARYGLPMTFGRVFGLLLLSNESLSLDEAAAQLEASKSGVSLAARDLERMGLARRIGTPGSRRVRYEAMQEFEPFFEAEFTSIRQQLTMMQRADALLAPGAAKDRLHALVTFFEFWLEESDGLIARWRQRRMEP